MNTKKHIPNFITLLNLVCGVLAILLFVEASCTDYNNQPTIFIICIEHPSTPIIENGLLLILIATLLDFMDGFAARLLNVKSEIGAQLDSLADMVTFGVAPGFLFYTLAHIYYPGIEWLKYLFILIPIFSAIRLAKFNVDTEQTTYFKGLATPANAIFWVGFSHLVIWGVIPFYLLAALIIIMSLLMVSNFKMFSLKVSNLKFEGDNIYRISLIGLIIVTLVVCSLLANIFFAIPIIIILYILLSIPYHLNHNKNN